MKNKHFGLIMAGGQGTRFWPWSTEHMPKQFLNIVGKEPLITQTYNRLKHFIPTENIFIVADIKYLGLIMDAIPGFKQSNFVTEPMSRNTAPCLILANIRLSRIDEEANVLVVPADHYIPDTSIFAQQMQDALDYADNRCIITSGIKPTEPHTGYGYLHFEQGTSGQSGNTSFYKLMEFKEKPEQEVARQYLADGNYYWNSGIFIYKVRHFKEFLGEYSPYYFIQYNELAKVYHHKLSLYEMFSEIKPDSIDYALMEKVQEIEMFKASFEWNDVGAWSSVYELKRKDSFGNATDRKKNIFIDSENSMIFSTEDKPVAAIGLDNIAVINTANGVLVADMNKLQQVKEAIQRLNKQI
ncbi:MAG: mannose-1-phosphate guanylyltransferase [bacterium]|nr:mannose-1-phosphate guanylyltransferase [bacterium]